MSVVSGTGLLRRVLARESGFDVRPAWREWPDLAKSAGSLFLECS